MKSEKQKEKNYSSSSKKILFTILFASFLLVGAIFVSGSDGNSVYLSLFSKATPVINADSYVEIAKGNVPGHSIINKFGRNPDVGTTLSFISISGEYQTPTTPQSLEIVSTSPLDTVLGTGGRSVIIIGLDENFTKFSQEVNLSGTTPVAVPETYLRVYRMYVASSGTYASLAGGSHAGDITLRTAGAGVTWLDITVANNFGIGQSQTSGYTVPKGHTAFLLSKTVTGEAAKSVSTYFFKRENSEDITSPYSGIMRLFEENDGLNAPLHIAALAPLNKFPERTDIGMFARVQLATGSVTAEYQLLLVENKYLK